MEEKQAVAGAYIDSELERYALRYYGYATFAVAAIRSDIERRVPVLLKCPLQPMS